MANAILEEIFQQLHSKVVNSVSPDAVIDVMFSKKIISSDELGRLRQVQFPPDRCRDLLTLLHTCHIFRRSFIFVSRYLTSARGC